jgi:hypothetical protein
MTQNPEKTRPARHSPRPDDSREKIRVPTTQKLIAREWNDCCAYYLLFLPSTEIMSLPDGWLEDAYLEDKWAKRLEEVQGRQFLRTRVPPTVGQRVEINMLLANRTGKRPDIHFAGQVVAIKDTPENYHPMENSGDREGSRVLSNVLGNANFRPPKIPDEMAFEPCLCGRTDCEDGYLYMPLERWEKNTAKDSSKDFCQDMVDFATMVCGAKHKQEIVCEGRLHFDHDSKFISLQ